MPRMKPHAAKPLAIEQEMTKWSCSFFGNKSEIDVFVKSLSRWETAALICPVGTFDAEEVAAFIVRALQGRQKNG